MSSEIDTDDLRDRERERSAESKRRNSLVEQLRSNWSIIVSIAVLGAGVWSSYDGLRKEVAKATESLTTLNTTVKRLSDSERTTDARVLQLEIRREALIDRVDHLEDWARSAGRNPSIRSFPAPPASGEE